MSKKGYNQLDLSKPFNTGLRTNLSLINNKKAQKIHPIKQQIETSKAILSYDHKRKSMHYDIHHSHKLRQGFLLKNTYNNQSHSSKEEMSYKGNVKCNITVKFTNSQLIHIKYIQYFWRLLLQRKNTLSIRIQKAFRGWLLYKLFNYIRIQNEKLEKMISIIQLICFTHSCDIRYETKYLLKKHAIDFMNKIILIQRKYVRYYNAKSLRDKFWDDYITKNLNKFKYTVQLKEFVLTKKNYSIRKIILIQKMYRNYIIRRELKKRKINKYSLNRYHLITKVQRRIINKAPPHEKIKFFLRQRVKSNIALFTKISWNTFRNLLLIQRFLKKRYAKRILLKKVKLIPLHAKRVEMFIVKHRKKGFDNKIIKLQRRIRFFIDSVVLDLTKFTKKIVLPMIYTKTTMKRTRMIKLLPSQITYHIKHDITYPIYGLYQTIGHAYRRTNFTQFILKKSLFPEKFPKEDNLNISLNNSFWNRKKPALNNIKYDNISNDNDRSYDDSYINNEDNNDDDNDENNKKSLTIINTKNDEETYIKN